MSATPKFALREIARLAGQLAELSAEVAALKAQIITMSASIDNLLAGHYLAAARWHATNEITRRILAACAGKPEVRAIIAAFDKTIEDFARQNLNDYLRQVADDAPAAAGYIQRLLAQKGALPTFLPGQGVPAP